MIDLSKQQALDADTKAIHQNGFTGNLDRTQITTIFFITEEAKGTISDFSQGFANVLWMSSYDLAHVAKAFDRTACSTILFSFNIISI